jgi:dTDP-4-amino-4,6-dideoxygalactose transaminase
MSLSSSKVPAIYGGRPAFSQPFPFIRPSVPALSEVVKDYEAAYRSGLLTNSNLVARFEGAVRERLRVKHCVAVSSCTSGLMMALRGLGLTGEVIVPSFTFFATGHAIRWNGLTPVFADCDPNSWTVAASDIKRKITPRTSAILAVHLYGNPCDHEAIGNLAKRNGLKLVFDAAHAFGSQRRGVPVGSFGDAEVFSLSPTKLLVAGEGGLVTTNDAKLAGAVRSMRNYGDLGAYNPAWIGLNARMSEFNAALAMAGLPLMEDKIRRRNVIANAYTEVLSGLPGVKFQSVDRRDVHTFKDYSIHVTAESFGMTRDSLASALLAENIETKKYFYPPLHKLDLYKPFYNPTKDNLTQTEYVTDGILSLPIYESLSDETVRTVAQAIKNIVEFEPHQSRSENLGRPTRVCAIQ